MTLIPAIWTVKNPAKWASSPEWMSFHYLKEAERCPRAVALRHSTYEGIWSRNGYPDRPSLFGLLGQIVHASVQTIISELAGKNCASLHDAKSVQILREMGGYSGIISRITKQVLASLDGNPRFARQSEQLASAVYSRMPEIREQVQVFLCRLKWTTRPRARTDDAYQPRASGMTPLRVPLPDGAHSEVKLFEHNLKWKGIADLEDYWNPAKRPKLSAPQSFKDDLEVVLRAQRGQTTWEAECRVSSVIPPSTTVLIRCSAADTIVCEHFQPGRSIRLTEAYVVLRDSGELPLVHVTTFTEPIFL
jgi:hypothetical protein